MLSRDCASRSCSHRRCNRGEACPCSASNPQEQGERGAVDVPPAAAYKGAGGRREPAAAAPRQPHRMGVHFVRLRPAAGAYTVCRKQVEEGGAALVVEGRRALTASPAIAAAAAADSLRLLSAAAPR